MTGRDPAFAASPSSPCGSRPSGHQSGVWFTPGPWSANFDDGDWYVAGHVDGHPWIIADIEPMVMSKAVEANAHLIAAAPELYEALADVRKLTCGTENCQTCKPIRNRIDAALAKARGEA